MTDTPSAFKNFACDLSAEKTDDPSAPSVTASVVQASGLLSNLSFSDFVGHVSTTTVDSRSFVTSWKLCSLPQELAISPLIACASLESFSFHLALNTGSSGLAVSVIPSSL